MSRAQAVQTAFIARVDTLVLPPNPLDTIIEALGGTSCVAEMTGRQTRLQRAVGGGVALVKRSAGAVGGGSAADAMESVNVREKKCARVRTCTDLLPADTDVPATVTMALQSVQSKRSRLIDWDHLLWRRIPSEHLVYDGRMQGIHVWRETHSDHQRCSIDWHLVARGPARCQSAAARAHHARAAVELRESGSAVWTHTPSKPGVCAQVSDALHRRARYWLSNSDISLKEQ